LSGADFSISMMQEWINLRLLSLGLPHHYEKDQFEKRKNSGVTRVAKLTKLLKDTVALPQTLIDFRKLHDNGIE
jgi:hypothetical protein